MSVAEAAGSAPGGACADEEGRGAEKSSVNAPVPRSAAPEGELGLQRAVLLSHPPLLV